MLRVQFNATANEIAQLLGITYRQGIVQTPLDILEQILQVLAPEGRPVCAHLVQDASQRPDIRFRVVGLVPPHFGAGVVGSARLGIGHALYVILHFGHVEVAQLVDPVTDEDVGALDVPVQDGLGVQYL